MSIKTKSNNRKSVIMKVIVAPDSYKGSLSSAEVAEAMARGVRVACPDASVLQVPLADGGEGTVRMFVNAWGCTAVCCSTENAIGEPVKAEFAVVERDGMMTCIVEVASASGLTLVPESRRNALRASSRGTGILVRRALDMGCRNFVVCLGGSACTDAGAGLMSALGVRFLDATGNEIGDGGGNLVNLEQIDVSGVDERLAECRFTAVCDVDVPLHGINGAAYVFAPQKGAACDDVLVLDEGLRRFSRCVKECLGVDVASLRGGGAAGGIGAALVAFCGARLRRGVDVVLDLVKFDDMVRGADVVLTGEGKADCQTLMGKLPCGVLESAKLVGVPVFLFSGAVECREDLLAGGFDEVECVTPGDMLPQDAMKREEAMRNIEQKVREIFIKRISISKS